MTDRRTRVQPDGCPERLASRREFMERGAAGALGALMAPSLALAQGASAGRRAAGRLLLRGGTVLTCDREIGDFARGDVLIEDGRIAQVGRDLGHTGAERIDTTGMIVMPGFVDTHRHMWQGLLRNIGPDDLLRTPSGAPFALGKRSAITSTPPRGRAAEAHAARSRRAAAVSRSIRASRPSTSPGLASPS